jgi:hypothetical protein
MPWFGKRRDKARKGTQALVTTGYDEDHSRRHEERRRNPGRRRSDYLRPKRNILTRLYFCISTVLATITGLVDPLSLGGMLLEEIGPPAQWIMTALLVITLAALVDVIVNDFLPPDWTFSWASRHRHLLYLAAAVVYASFIFVAIQRGHISMLLWRYLLDCSMAAVLAVLDVYHRHILPRELDAGHGPESERPWAI